MVDGLRKVIVQKYGGSSVSTPEKLKKVAELAVARRNQGFDIVVVVSAMGDATDELLAMARSITGTPDRRELDMLLSVGERISMALLAMAIRDRGYEAVSLTGSQCGIITTASHTSARIMEVRPFRVQDELQAGRVVIVAGYQGVSYKRDITTLGRGGSDTTAVALAAALDAEACEIYSDVAGVYTADPRVVPDAVALESLGYEEMQTLAKAGAKVLNAQAVEFAKRSKIALYARKTGSEAPGTVVRSNAPPAPTGVRGLAHQTQVAQVRAAATTMPAVQAFLQELAEADLAVEQIRFGGAEIGYFGCLLPLDDVHADLETVVRRHFGDGALRDGSGTISLVGDRMGPDVLPAALDRLRGRDIPVDQINSETFRITLCVPQEHVTVAARTLHESLGLAG